MCGQIYRLKKPIFAQRCLAECQFQRGWLSDCLCTPGFTSKMKDYGKRENMPWNHFYLPLEASNIEQWGACSLVGKTQICSLSYSMNIELRRQPSSCPQEWLELQYPSVFISIQKGVNAWENTEFFQVYRSYLQSLPSTSLTYMCLCHISFCKVS